MACSERIAPIVATIALTCTAIAGAQFFGPTPTTMPPMDAPVRYVRTLDATTGAGRADHTTHDVIGVYMENLTGSALRHPWPLFVDLRTNHAAGAGGVSVYSRLRNEGSGWAASFHTDTIASGTGTTIGVNIEPTPMAAGRVIGLNIQTTAHYLGAPATRGANQAINIQSGPGMTYGDGILFDGAACNSGIHFGPTSHGARAIAIEGVYPVGIDLGDAPLRMNAGTSIQLEASGAITVTYQSGKIIFRNRSRVLGYLVTDATANGRRLN